MPERPRPPLGSLTGAPCPVPSGSWTTCSEPLPLLPFPVSTSHRDGFLAGEQTREAQSPPERVFRCSLLPRERVWERQARQRPDLSLPRLGENWAPSRNLEAWSPAWPPPLTTSSQWLYDLQGPSEQCPTGVPDGMGPACVLEVRAQLPAPNTGSTTTRSWKPCLVLARTAVFLLPSDYLLNQRTL